MAEEVTDLLGRLTVNCGEIRVTILRNTIGEASLLETMLVRDEEALPSLLNTIVEMYLVTESNWTFKIQVDKQYPYVRITGNSDHGSSSDQLQIYIVGHVGTVTLVALESECQRLNSLY